MSKNKGKYIKKDRETANLVFDIEKEKKKRTKMKRIGFISLFLLIVLVSVVVGVKLGKNSDAINNENVDVVKEDLSTVGKFTVLKKYKRPTDRLYYT